MYEVIIKSSGVNCKGHPVEEVLEQQGDKFDFIVLKKKNHVTKKNEATPTYRVAF